MKENNCKNSICTVSFEITWIQISYELPRNYQKHFGISFTKMFLIIPWYSVSVFTLTLQYFSYLKILNHFHVVELNAYYPCSYETEVNRPLGVNMWRMKTTGARIQ